MPRNIRFPSRSRRINAASVQADLAASLNLSVSVDAPALPSSRRMSGGTRRGWRRRRTATTGRGEDGAVDGSGEGAAAVAVAGRGTSGEGRSSSSSSSWPVYVACAACSHWNARGSRECVACGCDFRLGTDGDEGGSGGRGESAPPGASAARVDSAGSRADIAEREACRLSRNQWQEIERRALRRESASRVLPECPICHEFFLNDECNDANENYERVTKSDTSDREERTRADQPPQRQHQAQMPAQALLCCSHIFHLSCLDSYERHVGWANRSCPVCRSRRYSRVLTDAGAQTHRAICASRIAAAFRGWARRKRGRRAFLRRGCARTGPEAEGVAEVEAEARGFAANGQLRRVFRVEEVKDVTRQIERRFNRDGSKIDSFIATLNETIGISKSANEELDQQLARPRRRSL